MTLKPGNCLRELSEDSPSGCSIECMMRAVGNNSCLVPGAMIVKRQDFCAMVIHRSSSLN